MRVEIKDTIVGGVARTILRTLFDNTTVFETFYAQSSRNPDNVVSVPYVYDHPGTIALLSGWASTKYRNVVVRDLNQNTIFYNLNSSIGTFNSDWLRVRNPDHSIDTGEWFLNQSTGEVSCDATTNGTGFYYPYNPNEPQNHGILPDGSANGKYAALVLVKSGATDLRNCQIDFDILIEKRNNFGAENGVGVRWHVLPTDSTRLLTEGTRVLWARNQFFAHEAKWISVKLRRDVLAHGVHDGPYTNQNGDVVQNFVVGGVNFTDVSGQNFISTTGALAGSR